MKKLLGIVILSLTSILLISCGEKKSQIKLEKVLLFGDSLMSGYGLPEKDHLSVILEKSLKSEGYEIQVFNGSVSGDTSLDGLDRIEDELLDESYDLIIIGLGANDMLRRINPNQTKQIHINPRRRTHAQATAGQANHSRYKSSQRKPQNNPIQLKPSQTKSKSIQPN